MLVQLRVGMTIVVQLDYLCSSSHFFAHQFIKNLGRAFVICGCFRQKVIDRQIGKTQIKHFPLGNETCAIWSQLRNSTSQFIVKSFVFFIGHSLNIT